MQVVEFGFSLSGNDPCATSGSQDSDFWQISFEESWDRYALIGAIALVTTAVGLSEQHLEMFFCHRERFNS